MKNRKLKNQELNRKSKKEYLKSKKTPLIFILDDIRSGHNVGSILRTADAFLLSKVYICGISPVPPHKEVMKTALGSHESVDWEYKTDIFDLVTELKNNNFDIWSIEQAEKSTDLKNFSPNKNRLTAFVLGNEVVGVKQKIIDITGQVIEIGQQGTKHSMNVSVVSGILCWDFYLKINI